MTRARLLRAMRVVGWVLLAQCVAAEPQPEPDTPYYYHSFDPTQVPWRAGEARNIEEVFKHYRYYEIVYGPGGRLTVTPYVRGVAQPRLVYERREDGGLRPVAGETAGGAQALYRTHCAACHGEDRLGRSGPALLPHSLGRLKRDQARSVVRGGRPATQMPGFGRLLDEGQIKALVELIYRPPATPVVWGRAQIGRSHRVFQDPARALDRPVFDADPLNLFLVVEKGDHHITVLDGDRLEPIHRFPTHYALHGGPKYSPDGRHVYLASRDGWISKFDLYGLRAVAETRAGINTRNLAISDDGRYVLVGNTLPHSLVLLDARDLSLLRLIPAADSQGDSSRVSAVYQAAPRHSFIIALKDLPQVWEMDYRTGGFPIRRIPVGRVLDDFFFDPDYRYLIGAERASQQGLVLDLDRGEVIAALDLPGMPHLGSGITWDYQGHTVMATPDLKEPAVTVIDMQDWRVIRRIPTLGPGFFMRSHERTPYAWVDVFFGPHRDAMHVIDKRSLEIVKTLYPEPGKTSAHVEFTRDGRYALVSIWEQDGAVVVYDANTLEEVKRLPMRKPSGKYNVYNKIHLSRGTSH